MKLIKLYLLALCLCLPNLLLAQEINLLLEEQLEELADDDETVNYDDLLEELSQPIDLNNATKEHGGGYGQTYYTTATAFYSGEYTHTGKTFPQGEEHCQTRQA